MAYSALPFRSDASERIENRRIAERAIARALEPTDGTYAGFLLQSMLETLCDQEGAITRLRAAFETSPHLDYWIVNCMTDALFAGARRLLSG